MLYGSCNNSIFLKAKSSLGEMGLEYQK